MQHGAEMTKGSGRLAAGRAWRCAATLGLAVLALGGALAEAASPTPPPLYALRFSKLVDGTGKSRVNPLILVEGDRIKSIVDDSTPLPPTAKVIDLRPYTAIPGLIDVHTHLTYYWDPQHTSLEGLDKQMAAMVVFLAQKNARILLQTGVTTVRDLGSEEYADIAMRELIKRGAMIGPRMFVAGYGLSVSREPIRPSPTYTPGRADGVAEVMRVVRQQLAAGVDVIKVYGSSGSFDDTSGQQTFTFEELKAAVDVAHQAGKRIAVHSYGPSGARDAVRAGADSIEHAVDIDDATLAEMVRRRTVYVPTIDHNRYYIDNAKLYGFKDEAVVRLRAFMERNLATTRRAVQAGVRIAMGSDVLYTMFGQNTYELGWLVRAGMTPAQALYAATGQGAALLGMEKELGAIAPGFFADIVAVEGDPLTDVRAIVFGVRWVMKGGTVVVDQRGQRS